MILKRIFILLQFLIVFLFTDKVIAQFYGQYEVGTPLLRNYLPKEYKANSQNWRCVQDKRGIMYFANGDGVLEYDGVQWNLIPIKNNYTVSSICLDSNGVIFTGSSSEFGYLKPKSNGELTYVSLIEKFPPKYRHFAFLWNMFSTKKGIYFYSNELLFRWYQSKISVWKIGRPSNCFNVAGEVFIWKDNVGLNVLKNDSVKLIKGGELFSKIPIFSILSITKQKLLLTTREKGFYLINNPQTGANNSDLNLFYFPKELVRFLTDNKLQFTKILKNGKIAFATSRAGVIVTDKNGNFVQLLDKTCGLQNETVYSVQQDNQQALWLPLDNGISKAEIGSPLSFWNNSAGLNGSVLSTVRYNNILYVATWQGVFYLDVNNAKNNQTSNGEKIVPFHFKPVSGIASESWDIKVITNPLNPKIKKLLVATSTGVFEINNNSAKQIVKGNFFKLVQSNSRPDIIFLGKSDGLCLLKLNYSQNSMSITDAGKINDISNKISSIVEDSQGRVWMGAEMNGVYLFRPKIDIKKLAINLSNKPKNPNEIGYDFLRFDTTDGLPQVANISIYAVNKNVIFSSNKGVFKIVEKNIFASKAKEYGNFKINKEFYPSAQFINTYYLYNFFEDNAGNYWMQINSMDLSTKSIVMLEKQQNGKFKVNLIPFKPLPPNDFYAIYPETNGITWLGGDDGLYRFDRNVKFQYNQVFNALIRKVKLENDSILFGGTYFAFSALEPDSHKVTLIQPDSLKPVLSYQYNSVSFEFAAPSYYDENSNRFKYFLEGFDKNWSDWSKESKKEYTNLPDGKYKFHVKAKNIFDFESTIAVFEFEVLPPWYQSILAIFGYILGFVAIIYYSVKYSNKRLIKAKIRLEEQVIERTKEIISQKREIEKEKEKSDKLLLNILPFKIAQELKMFGSAKAQYYEKVTVMFADFTGFTIIAEQLSPEDLISELDKCFVFFDEVCVRHNLEKIKTVGDSYMCAGGLPILNNSNPIDIILAAFEIQDFMKRIQSEKSSISEIIWELRIGINTGEVIAGVVGKKKFAYDIWGDSVNVASRMESAGEPNMINISGATYLYAKDFFDCTYRGKIAAKNKGEIDMYFVNGLKIEYAANETRTVPNQLFSEKYQLVADENEFKK